ncbi:hypothetical protein B0H14DRAFT_2207385, partial [Mycena olivaceomarginata]
YHDPVLENCAIAAMPLAENPHIKRKEILCVNLYDKGDPTFPVQQRFMVQSVGRRSSADLLPSSRLRPIMERYSQHRERGKLEFGTNFYG